MSCCDYFRMLKSNSSKKPGCESWADQIYCAGHKLNLAPGIAQGWPLRPVTCGTGPSNAPFSQGGGPSKMPLGRGIKKAEPPVVLSNWPRPQRAILE
jgi:hypothetical protein